MRKTVMNGLGLLLALAVGGVSPVSAQRVDPNRIVDLHVNAEGANQSFDGSVPEGQRFRLTFAQRGTFEISPILVNAATRTFRVSVYAGAEEAESKDLRLVEQVEARQGVPVAIRSMPQVSLVIDGTRARTVAAATGQPALYRLSANELGRRAFRLSFGTCCVTCGEIRACGCAVSMSCGSCCSDACCQPEEDPKLPPPGALNLTPRSFLQLAGRCATPVRDEERILTPRAARTVVASR